MKNQKGFASIALVIFVVVVAAGLGYFAFKNQTQNIPAREVFRTQGDCEAKTGKSCTVQLCDYAPPGKTIEEVCGKDFQKGWVPIPSTTSTAEIVNLQTYRDEKYGFEFKYPNDIYLISSTPEKIELSTMKPDDPRQQSSLGLGSSFRVSVVAGQTLEKVKKGYGSPNEFSESTDNINGEGVDVIVSQGAYGGEIHYAALFDRSANGYVLKIDFLQYQTKFKNVLATFKFFTPQSTQ